MIRSLLIAALAIPLLAFTAPAPTTPPASERLVIYSVEGAADACVCVADEQGAYVYSPESCPCQRFYYCWWMPDCCVVIGPEDLCMTIELTSVTVHNGECECTTGGTFKMCCFDVDVTIYKTECCTGVPCSIVKCCDSGSYTTTTSWLCDGTEIPGQSMGVGETSLDQTFAGYADCAPGQQNTRQSMWTLGITVNCGPGGSSVYPKLGTIHAFVTCVCNPLLPAPED